MNMIKGKPTPKGATHAVRGFGSKLLCIDHGNMYSPGKDFEVRLVYSSLHKGEVWEWYWHKKERSPWVEFLFEWFHITPTNDKPLKAKDLNDEFDAIVKDCDYEIWPIIGKDQIEWIAKVLLKQIGNHRECPQCKKSFVPKDRTADDALRLYNLLLKDAIYWKKSQ